MKKIVTIIGIMALLVSCTEKNNNSQSKNIEQTEENIEIKKNQDAIAAVIKKYESALSSGNVNSILDTYHDEATFLLFNHEPMQGKEALKVFYTSFFNNVSPEMEMKVRSIEFSGNLAYVISVSDGTVKSLANGAERVGAGQELFVLMKHNEGDWKIIAYHASARIKNELL